MDLIRFNEILNNIIYNTNNTVNLTNLIISQNHFKTLIDAIKQYDSVKKIVIKYVMDSHKLLKYNYNILSLP